eukprot:scaffold220059_cov30-Tisochrysis_lutea.AAC.1
MPYPCPPPHRSCPPLARGMAHWATPHHSSSPHELSQRVEEPPSPTPPTLPYLLWPLSCPPSCPTVLTH